MSEKEDFTACQCDEKAAGGMAASSVAKYFKENRWKIISFFPNAKCAGRVSKTLRVNRKKRKEPNLQNKPS